MPSTGVLRPAAEVRYAQELHALRAIDTAHRPKGWQMSPKCVVDFVLGTTLPDGTVIEPKYIGQRRLIEIAVATLVTDRALLLIGVPGTAKTWVSELLAAAICGNSTQLVQGTAGTHEDAIRYGWNYARLLAEGPSPEALVPSPVFTAMRQGTIVRIEELTRMPSDVQDALITILSEKMMPVPELGIAVQAVQGFNVIATANDRDKGVNELSSALRRRFNSVILPLPATWDEEVTIVQSQVAQWSAQQNYQPSSAPLPQIERLVTLFRELRSGLTHDGKNKIKVPSGTLSTAEAIAVIHNGQALATYFGSGQLTADDLAAALTGTVVKDRQQDTPVWQEYLETVVKHRKDWADLYQACKQLL